MKRIPSLDGLRAISILAVIGGHLAETGHLPLEPWILHGLERLPHLGVRVFFVISSFLITTLILDERARTKAFSLRKFYLRRTFRIFPPAYVFVFCLFIANLMHLISIPWLDYVRAITYSMNYGPVPNWPLGHLWSLAVEEQFYFIWPFLLAFCTVRVCRWIAVAFILISPVFLYHLVAAPSGDLWRQEYKFEYAGTALAFGCLLAIDRQWLNAQPWFRALCVSPLTAAAACGILLANSLILRKSGPVGMILADVVTNLCTLFLVAKLTSSPVGPIARVLNWKPLMFVGTISYSLYLWQQVFTNPGFNVWITAFPYNIFLIFLCALASYYLVERPTLKMRQALSRPALVE